ncbi:hypothetical protein FRC11_014815, partial [Ceratobasidium sp. 423]
MNPLPPIEGLSISGAADAFGSGFTALGNAQGATLDRLLSGSFDAVGGLVRGVMGSGAVNTVPLNFPGLKENEPIVKDNITTLQLHPRSLFRGFTLNSNNGPVQSGRQAIQKFYRGQNRSDVSRDDSGNPKDSGYIKRIPGTAIVEDEYSQNQLEAHYSHLGWPPPISLSDRPWSAPNAAPQAIEPGRWATRRMLVQMWSITLRVDELTPEDGFVGEVERALACPDDTSRIHALEEVLASWGEVIPV